MSNKLNTRKKPTNALFVVGGIALTSCLVSMTGSSASAAVFNLDSTIISGNVTSSMNYGTVTLTQNGSDVDVLVSLTQAWKPLSLYLNYSGANPITSPTTAINPYSSESVGFALNNKKVQGSGNYGNFDLEIPDNGNLGNFTTSWATKLKSTTGGLNLNDFVQTDSQGKLYAALHIGNGGLNTLPGGVNSIAIGASQAVPEPLTILGAATAAGIGAAFKRRSAKQSKE